MMKIEGSGSGSASESESGSISQRLGFGSISESTSKCQGSATLLPSSLKNIQSYSSQSLENKCSPLRVIKGHETYPAFFLIADPDPDPHPVLDPEF